MKQNDTCPLCSGPRNTIRDAAEKAQIPCHVSCFSHESFTVWRCANCNSLHCLEEVDLPKFYARYPFQKHQLDFHTRVAYRNRLRLLERAGVHKEMRILEFGCGKGLFVHYLRAQGYTQTCGFDPFIEEFSDPSVLNQQFDLVTSYDVIEHVDDPKAYLAMLVERVAPGGFLVIGTPNADHISLQTPLQVELSQPYHRHIFSEAALREMARSAALVPVHIHRRFYYDSLVPFVNTRFMWEYVKQSGGMIDVCVEPPRWRTVLSSPKLLLFALVGYLFPPRGNILITFRKAGGGEARLRNVA